jgi:CheY-like chemotaxis protein
LGYSNVCHTIGTPAVPGLAWLFAKEWLSGTEDASGSNPNPEKEPPSSSPSRSTDNPSIQRRLNLLVAEDNLPDTLLVREAIRMENLPLEVHVASDGQKAIDFIAAAEADPDAPYPDLLLLDLNLPKRDGFEVLRRLRASPKYKDIPVLIMTSSDSAADHSRATELGARYFRKPPNYDEFLKLGKALRELMKDGGVG